MENVPGFFFVFGAAIIVAIIIFSDIYKREKALKPYAKWLTVFLLSLWQVGCWHALKNLDASFGNNSDMAVYEILFIGVVVIWFVYQLIRHLTEAHKH